MSVYINEPNAGPITLLQAGRPEYVWGSFNDHQQNAKFAISNSVLTSNVATLTVVINDGDIPAVGSLVTVRGTTRGSGAYNVVQVALTDVTVDAVTGAGTISYAVTHANVATGADGGQAIVQVPEVAVAITNNTSTKQVVVPFQPSQLNQGRALKATCSFPTVPTAVTVSLQEATFDVDSEYSTIATVGSVAASVVSLGQVTISSVEGRYYRARITGLTGSGTMIIKILA